MSELVVITFANEEDAKATLERLRGLEKAGQLGLEDTAVIAKDPDGKIHVKNEWSSGAETGALIGGAFGLLTSFILPVIGTVVGAAAGGWVGSKISEGIDKKFVEDVSTSLEPGKSAIFLLVKQWNAAAVTGALKDFEGTVLQTTLSPELVDELERALR